MKIIYSVSVIDGRSYPQTRSRIAKERLRAVIEEGIMDYDVASGYTIISSKNICFPFRKQKMRDDLVGFIVGYQSMGECQKELDLLCSQPRQEIDNYKKSDLNSLNEYSK